MSTVLCHATQIIALAQEMGIKTINQVHRDTYVQELKDLG